MLSLNGYDSLRGPYNRTITVIKRFDIFTPCRMEFNAYPSDFNLFFDTLIRKNLIRLGVERFHDPSSVLFFCWRTVIYTQPIFAYSRLCFVFFFLHNFIIFIIFYYLFIRIPHTRICFTFILLLMIISYTIHVKIAYTTLHGEIRKRPINYLHFRRINTIFE